MNRRTIRTSIRAGGLALLVMAVAALATAMAPERVIEADTAVLDLPQELGRLERPAVEFPHQLHVDALSDDGCESCHQKDNKGFQSALKWAASDLENSDDFMHAFHDGCIGCHQERASKGQTAGPNTCGECHIRLPQGRAARTPISFDYSLHARHALAYPEKCDTCHHHYDEAAQKLVYEKGREDSCRDCHGAVAVDNTPSLSQASHTACVRCHLDRSAEALEAGPSACTGCHDAAHQASFEELEEIPRLIRGQPDDVWVQAPGGTSSTVAFHHLGHETRTSSCSTCHHQTVKACTECHTLAGSPEGQGITAQKAYHQESSERSCVGCHATEAAASDCSGCHDRLVAGGSERTCVTCHQGPRPGEEALEHPPLPPVATELAPLPQYADASFPEEVKIDFLVDSYGKSILPHGKIVTRLNEIVRNNGLASHFHGSTDVLCSGCHHRSPVGTRPPPCRSCHSTEAAEATTDKPALKAAYHRQCIGCHQQMNIKQGCTDCHEKLEDGPALEKEVEG